MLTFRKKVVILLTVIVILLITKQEEKKNNQSLKTDIVNAVIVELDKNRNDKKNDAFLANQKPKEESLDCNNFDLIRSDRLSQDNVRALFSISNNIGIDPYYLMSVAIIKSNFDISYKDGLFGLGSHKIKGIPFIVEDVMYMEIVDYLLKAKIVTEEDLALQNKHIQGSLIKGYVSVYGEQSLNKLYNYYYVLSGKRLK